MELSVKNKEGKETGRKVSLDQSVFGVEPNTQVVYLAVKQYLANQRQGTHKSKERAEINLTGKKLLKQKGSGGARHGSKRAPIFVGGGRAFGPRPRNYSFKINDKVNQLARKSVLSDKAKQNTISIVEDFSFSAPKTKDYLAFLAALELNGKKTLFVIDNERENNLYLSSRNIPKTKVLTKDAVSTYDIINADQLIISENSLSFLTELLKTN